MESVLQTVGDHVDLWLGIGGLGVTGFALHCLYAGTTSVFPWSEEDGPTENTELPTMDLEEGRRTLSESKPAESPSKMKLEAEALEKFEAEAGSSSKLDEESPRKRMKFEAESAEDNPQCAALAEPAAPVEPEALEEVNSTAAEHLEPEECEAERSANAAECTAPAEQVEPVSSETALIDHDAETWLRAFKDAGDGSDNPNMPEIRALRQGIWWQTAFLIGNTDFSSFTQVVKAPRDLWHPQAAQGPKPQVEVLERDCLEEAMRLSRSFSVAVLNMASSRCPGGGVNAVAGAQQKNIFRRSNLANFLHPNFYPLSEEDCVVSGGVDVFRGQNRVATPSWVRSFKPPSCHARRPPVTRFQVVYFFCEPHQVILKCSLGNMLFFRCFLTQNRAKSKDRS